MATKYLDLLIAILFSSTCLLQDTSAAIKPEDASYTAESGKDFVISWQYDNEENTSQIFWTYKSSALPTANTIMSKIGTASAQVFNNFNVEHGGKGVIKLLSVTTNNTGIYFCQVSYALGSNLPSVTGTATLSVTDCGCTCECDCHNLPIPCIVFSISGVVFVGLAIFILCSSAFRHRRKLFFVFHGACIVSAIISIICGALARVLDCDCECCTESCPDCCPERREGLIIAGLVISSIVLLKNIIIGFLVCIGVIPLRENADMGKPADSQEMNKTSL